MFLISWLLLVTPVLSAATIQRILSANGTKVENGYIVQLKEGANQTEVIDWLQSTYGPSGAVVEYTYPPQVSLSIGTPMTLTYGR